MGGAPAADTAQPAISVKKGGIDPWLAEAEHFDYPLACGRTQGEGRVSSYIHIDQLQVGLYVQLDLKWTEHPFGFNSFKIRNAEQIQSLRSLGLERIRFDPLRSTARPLPLSPLRGPQAVVQKAQAIQADDHLIQAKRSRVAYLAQYRQGVAKAEQVLQRMAREVRATFAKLPTQPGEARAEAEGIVERIAATLLAEADATIHALGGKDSPDLLYHHGLNVAVLSLIMAKGTGMSHDESRLLGLGALLHDIGLAEVPSRILRKTEPLTAAEYALRQAHCALGVDLGRRMGLPPAVLEIIGQHHELMDGSGYPNRLPGNATSPLARLVQVANRYDSLCNPTVPTRAMSPHEALSFMFAQQAAKHDPTMLRSLIRSLGVYPPGTVVHLSNGATALVTTVNPVKPLKPVLVVYEPSVPREEAIVIDLARETDVQVAHALSPGQIPRAISDYLCMRRHVSYYFGEGSAVSA